MNQSNPRNLIKSSLLAAYSDDHAIQQGIFFHRVVLFSCIFCTKSETTSLDLEFFISKQGVMFVHQSCMQFMGACNYPIIIQITFIQFNFLLLLIMMMIRDDYDDDDGD